MTNHKTHDLNQFGRTNFLITFSTLALVFLHFSHMCFFLMFLNKLFSRWRYCGVTEKVGKRYVKADAHTDG